jgi:hypothetical protein
MSDEERLPRAPAQGGEPRSRNPKGNTTPAAGVSHLGMEPDFWENTPTASGGVLAVLLLIRAA